MKTTTTTREYDADGNMVKETVTEYDSGPTVVRGYCTCGQYNAYCPLHGFTTPWYPVITSTTSGPTITINSPSATSNTLGKTISSAMARGVAAR